MYEKIFFEDNLRDISVGNTDSMEVASGTSVNVTGAAIDLMYLETVRTNEYLLLIIAFLLITFAWKQIVTNMRF